MLLKKDCQYYQEFMSLPQAHGPSGCYYNYYYTYIVVVHDLA